MGQTKNPYVTKLRQRIEDRVDNLVQAGEDLDSFNIMEIMGDFLKADAERGHITHEMFTNFASEIQQVMMKDNWKYRAKVRGDILRQGGDFFSRAKIDKEGSLFMAAEDILKAGDAPADITALANFVDDTMKRMDAIPELRGLSMHTMVAHNIYVNIVARTACATTKAEIDRAHAAVLGAVHQAAEANGGYHHEGS